MKRVCPECGEANYSACEGEEYWSCWNCGAEISISLQENT